MGIRKRIYLVVLLFSHAGYVTFCASWAGFVFLFVYSYLEEDLADVVVQHVGYVTCCASWTGGMFALAAPAAAAVSSAGH